MMMSTEPVQIVRSFIEDVVKEVVAGRPPRALEIVHPEIVVSEPGGVPWAGDHAGMEALQVLMQRIHHSFEIAIERYTVEAAGTYVVLQAVVTFTSRESGSSASTKFVEIYELRDGLIWRIDVYFKDVQTIADLHARTTARSGGGRVPVAEPG